MSKENNEKIIEFFTNHIKNNKYIIKDIDVKNGKAVAYIDIIGIDFENYLPEIIIARRKILEQENSDNIEELQNLAFDLILLPLN